MSCSIESRSTSDILVEPGHIAQLYKYIFKDTETGGELKLNFSGGRSKTLAATHEGLESSVSSPDAIINWHSHPASCYVAEKTVWGWLSGEDMRETLVYGLKGSLGHIVPTVEGLYVVRPNPCLVTKLLNMPESPESEDFTRGFVILAAEIYFRSSHVFRTLEFNKKYSVGPEQILKFTNGFSFASAFGKKISVFEDSKFQKISIKDYIEDYEGDTRIFEISKSGSARATRRKFKDVFNDWGKNYLRTFRVTNECNIPIGEYQSDKVFFLDFYENLVSGKPYSNMTLSEKVGFLKNPVESIKISSQVPVRIRMFKAHGDCTHDDVKKHLNDFSYSLGPRPRPGSRLFGLSTKSGSPRLVIYGSDVCGFCVRAKARYPDAEYRSSPDVQSAKDRIQREIGHVTRTVPVFVLDGKVISEDQLG